MCARASQLLRRNVKRFVFKAHRLVHHSTLGSSVVKKKEKHPDAGLSHVSVPRRASEGVAFQLCLALPWYH